jgi:hypothetical protein
VALSVAAVHLIESVRQPRLRFSLLSGILRVLVPLALTGPLWQLSALLRRRLTRDSRKHIQRDSVPASSASRTSAVAVGTLGFLTYCLFVWTSTVFYDNDSAFSAPRHAADLLYGVMSMLYCALPVVYVTLRYGFSAQIHVAQPAQPVQQPLTARRVAETLLVHAALIALGIHHAAFSAVLLLVCLDAPVSLPLSAKG